jgi:predicted metal-dependent phosphoesterase TrpH
VVLKTGFGHKISSATNIDAVEVINAAAFPFFLSNYISRRLAQRLRLPQTAGSDAHHPREIGKAYTLVDADSNRDDVIEAIRKGKTTPFGKPIPWAFRLQRIATDMKIKRRGR